MTYSNLLKVAVLGVVLVLANGCATTGGGYGSSLLATGPYAASPQPQHVAHPQGHGDVLRIGGDIDNFVDIAQHGYNGAYLNEEQFFQLQDQLEKRLVLAKTKGQINEEVYQDYLGKLRVTQVALAVEAQSEDNRHRATMNVIYETDYAQDVKRKGNVYRNLDIRDKVDTVNYVVDGAGRVVNGLNSFLTNLENIGK